MARDLWVIPSSNDIIDLTAIDAYGDGNNELVILKKEEMGDVNIYYYNSLVDGDWTYWDAIARNPSPMARDLWVMPSSNDVIDLTAIDAYGDGNNELVILKREGAGDVNIYYYNSLVPGDWTYWDAIARNPSPYAEDFWIIPVGNDAVGITAIRTAK